jgi:hypothetical protein
VILLKRRAAFTLVEVLLTSVLTATLLAALWGLLAMYSKMFDTGQTKTEQSQLARTLLAQISDDLHSVVQAPPLVPPMPLLVPATPSGATNSNSSTAKSSPASSTPATSAAQATSSASKSSGSASAAPSAPNSANSSAPSTPTSSQGPASNSAGQSNSSNSNASSFGARRGAGRNTATSTMSLRPAGLVGTENYLQIDVLQATAVDPEIDPSVSLGADGPPVTRAAELRTVVYAVEELRDTTLTEPRMLLTRREMDWETAHPAARGPAGRRSAQSRLPMPGQTAAPGVPGARAIPGVPGAPTDATLEGFDEASTVSVPEVMQFRLRYFDGKTWSNQWDSGALKRLPAAVEVAMHLRSFDEPDPATVVPVEPIGEELGGLKPKLPVYRLVIHLPDAAAGATSGTLPPGRGLRPAGARTLGANANALP